MSLSIRLYVYLSIIIPDIWNMLGHLEPTALCIYLSIHLSIYLSSYLTSGICLATWNLQLCLLYPAHSVTIASHISISVSGNIIVSSFFSVKLSMLQYCPFHFCSPSSYCSSNFATSKVVALNLFASFLYWFCTVVHGFFSILLP